MDIAHDRLHLAELVTAAEGVHRTDPGHLAEQARWAGPARRPGYDGVPAYASVAHPNRTLLPGRDFAGSARRLPSPARRWSARTGLIVVLSTERDDPPDWLRAGQALERILLHAATRHVMAAFHTQPLELPRLRTRVRETLTAGEFPQMILRLGSALSTCPVPRRPAMEVLTAGATRSVGVSR